jgi:EAL domain-containing protein (putative c-di-GMP-specific phosphodiesterase class I)
MMPGGEPNIARELASKLLSSVNQLMIDLEQRTIQPTISIGITMITDNSISPQESLQQAHYAAEAVATENTEQQGNGLHIYMPEDQTESIEVKALQQELSSALRKNTLKLAFQPLISLKGEEGEHYEVLLRLPQNGQSDLSAGDFIHSNDVSDELKIKIDRWVILHSTKLLAEHQRKGNDTRVFINLSSASFRDSGLPAWIQVALKAAGLNHNSVIFQITEEDAVRHTAPAKRFSYQIRASGLSMAVNRFGCELQPLKLLNTVEFDYVKLDGSYTQELGSNAASGKALRTLLEGVHEKGKVSIAPFVESATSVSGIWQYGVHFIQGHYVQAPQNEMSYDFSEE